MLKQILRLFSDVETSRGHQLIHEII